MIELTIHGPPIPKLRPRFLKCGQAYDIQAKLKKKVIWQIKEILILNYFCVAFPLKGPIACDFKFYMPVPTSWKKKEKNLVSWKALEHTCKPDCDNLVKFYLDCMNSVVYQDDRQIVIGNILKEYDANPRVEITIMGTQKPIMSKVEEILGMFSADEFGELVADLEIVADCLDMEFINQRGEVREKLQLEAAYTLSLFADKHAEALSKITKKYPGIWKNILEYEKKNYKDDEINPEINGICFAP